MQFAPLYPLVHRVLKPMFPGCLWTGRAQRTKVALTFDDGPHPRYTPQLLKVLEQYNVTASFFWLGACVRQNPTIAQAVSDRGHWIGLHGYDHRSFPMLSPSALKETLEKTQTEIAIACGLAPQSIRDVRPPNGLFTPQTLDLLQQWHYRTVMWSVVPEDWVSPGVNIVVQRVLQQVQNGSIIVLHDGACGGADVTATAEQLIPQLLQKGYELVTIDAFWQEHSTYERHDFKGF